MKLPVPIAEKLILLLDGGKVPYSQMKHDIVISMIDNGILGIHTIGRTKKLVYLRNNTSLMPYLRNHFGIEILTAYIEGCRNKELNRAEAIEISSNSKLRSTRTFKGFLVNCYQPVECFLNNQNIMIQPNEGTFTFIYDYESFIPSEDITIVGVENSENFRYVEKQRKWFSHIKPLFVSRYPQEQHKDLIMWLQSIPNPYLHFGDFDLAGLNIYWNEFRKHLKEKASFFLPPEIEKLLSTYGNRDNYIKQAIQFDLDAVNEDNVLVLIRLIEKYRKGLEQEILML
ncbi:MAG: hypothetical protein WCP85_15860 [Mariniphaga sp.]